MNTRLKEKTRVTDHGLEGPCARSTFRRPIERGSVGYKKHNHYPIRRIRFRRIRSWVKKGSTGVKYEGIRFNYLLMTNVGIEFIQTDILGTRQ